MARPVSWYSFRSTHQKRALIFVHGYNGDPRESWRAFARLLLADQRFADWDILSFGYGIRSSILGAAASLTSRMSQPEMSGYTELAFVTHSIGGLIVQRALVDNDELAGRVRLAFFFASPNAGMRLPRLFRIPWLSHIASPLDELSPGSPLLQELDQRWNQKFGLKTPFEYWSIAADRDAFVSAVSLSAVPLEHRLVVSADHLSLIRPETPQAGGFRVVTEALMYRDVPASAKKAAQGSVAVEEKREAGISDVFLHCNHVDTEVVLEVAQQLRAAGFEPWLVVEKATTGKPWNESLMRDIDKMKAVAICIGKEGPGWRDREQAAVAGEFARRGCSVIPVYLTSSPRNAGDVIEDLNVYPVVDFRQPGTEPLEHLIEGISGHRPTKVTQAFTEPKESLNVVVTQQSRHRVVSWIMTSAAILLAVVVIAIKIVNRGVVIPGNPSIKAAYLGEGPHTQPVVVSNTKSGLEGIRGFPRRPCIRSLAWLALQRGPAVFRQVHCAESQRERTQTAFHNRGTPRKSGPKS
jgi:pimeloyl-ACP methyl ester carboxylesterase